MNKRILGRSGIEVSEIAFGGVEIGLPYGIDVNSKADMPSEKDALNLLHKAADEGINFFDTARMYGDSEALIGKAFKNMRERVIICSKCAHLRDESSVVPSADKLREIIEKSISESLNMLQTDYIDVYLLHQADKEILQNAYISELFLRLKERGLIRAAGASTYDLSETEMVIESDVWDVVQLHFNLMNQTHGAYFKRAHQKGVGIMVRSVLFKGILSEKGRNLHEALQRIADYIKKYDQLLDENIPDLPALALKFALSFEEVSSVLVGIDRLDYLYKALASANGNYLNEKTLSRAKALAYPDPQFLDLVKWDKMGWLT